MKGKLFVAAVFVTMFSIFLSISSCTTDDLVDKKNDLIKKSPQERLELDGLDLGALADVGGYSIEEVIMPKWPAFSSAHPKYSSYVSSPNIIVSMDVLDAIEEIASNGSSGTLLLDRTMMHVNASTYPAKMVTGVHFNPDGNKLTCYLEIGKMMSSPGSFPGITGTYKLEIQNAGMIYNAQNKTVLSSAFIRIVHTYYDFDNKKQTSFQYATYSHSFNLSHILHRELHQK